MTEFQQLRIGQSAPWTESPSLAAEAFHGAPRPVVTTEQVRRWIVEQSRVTVAPESDSEIEIEFEVLDFVFYPTNFMYSVEFEPLTELGGAKYAPTRSILYRGVVQVQYRLFVK